MDSIETIITGAMMGALDGTLNPPGVSLARIAVSNAVQRAISCQSPTKCGRVLDQSSAALFSFGEDAEHGAMVVCGKCMSKWEDFSRELSQDKDMVVTVETWRGASKITPGPVAIDGEQLDLLNPDGGGK